jgi:hypothetical protein
MDNKSTKNNNLEFSPKLSKYDTELVAKVLDSNYSLFEEVAENLPKFSIGSFLIVAIFAFIGLGTFIFWLYHFIMYEFSPAENTLLIGLFISLILPLPIFFILSYIDATSKMKKIRLLLSSGNLEELRNTFKAKKPKIRGGTYEGLLVFFALLSVFDRDTILLLPTMRHDGFWLKYKKMLQLAKVTLAIKLNFSTIDEFIKDIEEQLAQIKDHEELIAIPITKAYEIFSLPEGTQCIISKTQIDSSSDLLVCPYCISFAKADLLNEWLKYNNRCPSCNRFLKIEDCPVVVIKSDN